MKLNRFLFFLILHFAFCILHSFAQPAPLPGNELDLAGSVYGIITDKQTGEPVFLAEVLLDNSSRSVRTDENGKYHLRHLSYGSHKLIYFAYGYEKVEQFIDIKHEKLEINIALQPLVMDLKDVVVKEEKDNDFGITRLKPVDGIAIYAGKKSEVVIIDDVAANLATNNSRQVFAKVAGLNIWESDGAGLQIGIGGRGLSPNRTSNFNTRQNGYDISADALGYPESYYSPPTEALEKIEVVRGAASLQYGTQFGGFINFVFKKPNSVKPLEFISRQTAGSFGLFNSFNSISGTQGKLAYYAYYQFKRGDGWRPNSTFNNHAAHASVAFKATKKLSITLEHTFMHYLAQQPGGLTDVAFTQDPRQSIRERNWFRVNWNLTALMVDYKFNDRLKLNSRFFGLIADRSALGFLGLISRADPMEERDLLWDKYRNFGNETRIMYGYNLLGNHSTLLAGVRYYQGHTYRRQGFGNDGSEADFYYENPDSLEFSEYTFPSRNVAVFAENIFAITSKFSVTPGVRYEYISTACDGYFNVEYEDLAGNVIYREHNIDKRKNNRSFVLLGIGASYKLAQNLEFYGNFSQNYRAITFSDMRIINPNFRVDPNLQDEKGYNTDLGVRGNINRMLNFDLSVFMISYNNRIGADLRLDSNTYVVYRYRTNIADSRNIGVEFFAELDLIKLFSATQSKSILSVFTNCSFIDARYFNSSEEAFNYRKVELVPMFTNKSGITFKRKNFQATCQFSYTSQQFSDATNAEFSPNGVYGIIPAYYVMDFSLNYTWKLLSFSGGLNNITNNKYFTRRAESYPGPGIIPSDGRSFYITVGVKL
ncbi:MAG: Fe(3+) dicitrate transport protein FecA [Bacteroidia bacterium]|nr:Fe(3+) dicitrate transport protein FecA [Bacteroidia bacterium]